MAYQLASLLVLNSLQFTQPVPLPRVQLPLDTNYELIKLLVMFLTHHSCCISLYIDIFVGWERTFTEVSEDIGTFQLCVLIMNLTQDVELANQLSFFLDVQTVPGTAGKGVCVL